MTGPFHVRAVATVFILAGIAPLIPYAQSFFQSGGLKNPSGLVAAIADIALAIWFTRGSNIARYVLIFFSGIGVLWSGAFFYFAARGYPEVAVPAVIGVTLCGYCVWVLAANQEVRAELTLRRQANRIKDPEERKRFYEAADPDAQREIGLQNE